MSARIALRFVVLLFVFDCRSMIARVHAQVFDLERDRVQLTELKGSWRFHAGDDPRWSEPAFDDSSWPLLRSDEPWDDQGYASSGGLAWYRFGLVLPSTHQALSLRVPPMGSNYQLYANGRLIGQHGTMPPHAVPYGEMAQVFSLPPDTGAKSAPVQIAMRVWHWPVWAAYQKGGPSGAVQVGSTTFVDAFQQLDWMRRYWSLSGSDLQLVIFMLAGIASLALFSAQRSDMEYLWFGLFQLFWAATLAFANHTTLHVVPLRAWNALQETTQTICDIFYVVFVWSFLRSARKLLFWLTVFFVTAGLVPELMGNVGWLDPAQQEFWSMLLFSPSYLTSLVFLFRETRRNHYEAVFLAVACGGIAVDAIAASAFNVYVTAGHPDFATRIAWFYNLANWPFPFSVSDVCIVGFMGVLFVALVIRFSRTRRDEQRLHSELEAARLVQHVLIPEQLPTIPGYQIESVYKPMGEVGGDFFQIITLASGSALVAIGDVSGKGLPAAMTVSLLVGTLRTASAFSQSPAFLLSAMNDSLVERSAGGFTTCLVSRIDPDDTITLANAGHLAPYLGQQEVALDNGLPLGLVAQTKYTETTLTLGEAQQITFMTDGVVEARSRTGELFGFERTALLVASRARDIAEAAYKFGQDDDITVVTIKRLCQEASGKTQTITFPLLHAAS